MHRMARVEAHIAQLRKVAGKVTQDYVKLEFEIIYLGCLYSIHRVKNIIRGGLKNMTWINCFILSCDLDIG